MKKIALLDTDFISKTHIVRTDDDHHLIDCVLELPGYSFFCHEQTVVELSRHNAHAPAWLNEKIQCGVISQYTDARIIHEMTALYKKLGLYQHALWLKNACNAFDRDYFQKHYGDLDSMDLQRVSEQDYLSELQRMDSAIGAGNNLGEIKEYVLLQWLNAQHDEPIFYFCSDDKHARNGVLAVDSIPVQCISLVSAYQRLRKDGVFTKENAKPYVDAALNYFDHFQQTTIRVIEATPVGRQLRVPCAQVFREIFDDQFDELPNGFLKYRQSEA